jgi:hypothetical protein
MVGAYAGFRDFAQSMLAGSVGGERFNSLANKNLKIIHICTII